MDEEYKWCATCEQVVNATHRHKHPSHWNKVSRLYRAKHPCCHDCEAKGLTVVATEVHHKIKPKHGGSLYDFDNLMSLCGPCHDYRTNVLGE